MKKLILISILSVVLFSCKKDDETKPIHSVSVTPPPHPSGVCYGGYI